MPTATLGWVASLLGLAALVGAGWLAVALVRDSPVEDQRIATLRMVMARSELERSALDLVTTRLLDELGVVAAEPGQLDRGADRLQVAVAALDELAALDGVVGLEAGQLADGIEYGALADPRSGDLTELFWIADDARYWAASVRSDPAVRSVEQLTVTAALPDLIVIEALVGLIAVEDLTASEEAAEFAEPLVEMVRSDGGWLEPDGASVLASSVWFDLETARERLPSAVERIEAAFDGSDLVRADRWLAGLRDGDAQPTLDASSVAVSAREVRAAVVPIVEASGDALADELAVGDEESSETLELALAVVLGVIGLSLLLLGARDVRDVARDARERSLLATCDALTGVGNRHRLDDVQQVLAANQRLAWHVAAIVDLDRFKMVNDLYGHAAGDAVLVEAAAGLSAAAEAVAAETERTGAQIAFDVIRLGGDEFLLTFHSDHPVDVQRLRDELERCRQVTVEPIEGHSVTLAFSVGIATASGTCDLDDVMRAADLAAYEDKADRRAARQAALGEEQDLPVARP